MIKAIHPRGLTHSRYSYGLFINYCDATLDMFYIIRQRGGISDPVRPVSACLRNLEFRERTFTK